MGQEILYCFKCQVRVTSADLDSSNALRFGNRTACRNCVPDLLAGLSAQERKDLVSRVQSPPKKGNTGRYSPPPTPRPKSSPVGPDGRSNQVMLWAIGVVAAALVVGIILLSTGGSTSPPPQREPSVGPAPRAPEESPRERAAREAITRAKTFPSTDPEGQLAAFEQAVRAAEGTSREREAKELRDEFIALRRKGYSKELSAVEERARGVVQKEEFGAALAIYEAVRSLHAGPEWKGLVDAKVDDVRKAVEAVYLPLKEQASSAQARRVDFELKSIRDRVVRWGLPEKSADLDAHLKRVQPPPAGLKWTPLFDGTSLDFLSQGGEGAWVVDNGGLLHVPDRKASAQTKRLFSDGDFRLRFKFRQADHVGVTVRQSVEGYYFVALNGAELNQLDDRQHEFFISCRGSEVKAFLDDKPFPVQVKGQPTKGALQFNAHGAYFVVKTLEFREPADLERPVGHWTMDTIAEGKVPDISGKENHGTAMDGPVPVLGAVGGALQFDGRRSHVAVASSPSLSVTGPLTVCAWVNLKPASDPPLARAIVEKWDGTSTANYNGFMLRVSTKGNGHFVISESTRSSEVSTTKVLPTETWVFLSGVFDGSSVQIYVNGALDRSVPATASPGISQGQLRIGMGGGGGAHYFHGAIDDVRVYARALSAEEIARLAAGR